MLETVIELLPVAIDSRGRSAVPASYHCRLLVRAPIWLPWNIGTYIMPFGIVISFDNEKGHGSIKPETGGVDLRFKRSDISWDNKLNPPMAGERLSYAVETNHNSEPCAVNIQPI